LANIPEVIDLARATKERLPLCFIFAGGDSISFVAPEVFEHAEGAIDCILRGEGEEAAPLLISACRDGDLLSIPGVITTEGSGPAPLLTKTLDEPLPARDLTRKRRKY